MFANSDVEFNVAQDLFRTVLESITDCIFVKDLNSIYLYANKSCLELWNKTAEEVIGQGDTVFFTPEVAARIIEIDRQIIKTGQSWTYSEQTVTTAGKIHVFVTTKSPYRDASGQIIGVYGISRDITAQKKAEVERREAEEHLRGVLENAPLPIYTVTTDGGFELANRNFVDFIHHQNGELRGKKLEDVLPVGDVHQIREINQRIIESGKSLVQEEWLDQTDGRHYYKTYKFPIFDDENNVKSVGAMVFDLTAHKRAEDRFRAVIESTASAILMVDTDGKIVLVNTETERLFGYTRSELIGQSVDMLVPDAVRPRHPELRNSYIARPRAVKFDADHDFSCRRKDGKEVPIEIGLDYLTTAEGHFVLISLIDISYRKQAEKAVRESEERLQQALRVGNAGIWDWDFIQDKIFWSSKHFEVLGYEPTAEGLGSYSLWEKCIHPEDLESVRCRWQETVNGGGDFQAEYRIVRHDNGDVRWMSGVGRCFFDKEKQPYRSVGVLTDITERKAAEQMVLVQETSLRLAADAATLGTWDFNYASKKLFVSEQLYQIFGASTSEAAGVGLWRKYTHADDLEYVLTQSERYNQSREVVYLEYRIVHQKTKQIRWIATSARTFFTEAGEPIRNVGVAQDITERKLAEQALRESEERYRQLIEFAPTSIFIVAADGVVSHVNPAACTLLRYKYEELVGMLLVNLVKTADLQKLETILGNSKIGSQHRGEWEVQRKDGTWVWIDCEARVLPSGSWQAFVNDISERKKIEQQLRQSQKMEAVGRLAGGVAHDFNNLLTVITGYSELMMWKLRKDDPFYKHIYEIKRAAERAAGLTGQLLAFSRQQPQQLTVLNLNHVIDNLKKMLNRVLNEDIILSTSLDEELGQTKADQGQIEQILMNLVVNARDAMADRADKKILIETKNIYLTEEFAKTNLEAKPGRYVALIVSDTGNGMDVATQTQIFEPFFTTKEAGKGTGLGLSTVYGIVQQSGGLINVYSEPGVGTAFKIYLPCVDEPVHLPGKSELKPLVAESKSETVLLVEDDNMVRQLIKEVLVMNNYKVLEAGNGASAIMICDKYRQPIDLLLTDIVMPEMSGRKLAERLTTTHPKLQVIYMSGYTNDTVIHHGISTNAVNFIEKPFKFEDLIGKVREVLDKRLAN